MGPAWGAEAQMFESWPEILAWDMESKGPHELRAFHALAKWRHEPNALCLKYEEVFGDLGREVQVDALTRLGAFLGVEHPRGQLEDILDTVIGQPTITKMDTRTVASEYWSDEVERIYRRIGFPALNRELGYEEPAGA